MSEYLKPDLWDELPFWSAPFGLALLDCVRIKPGLQVLDIGSGTGFPMLELAARLGQGSSVTGIDPSQECLEVIHRKISFLGFRNASLVKAVAEQMPFGDNAFDLLISNNGMNNVQDQAQAFRECYRVCRQGGQFVFTVNLPHTFTEFYEVLEAALARRSMNREVRAVKAHIELKRKPAEYLRDLALLSGFSAATVIPDGFRYRFSDAEACFNHPLIRNFFYPLWAGLVPEEVREEVFSEISDQLNLNVLQQGCLEMSVPFACFDLTK